MAKFYGAVGYASPVQTTPGVWKEDIIEKKYYGELVRNVRNLQTSQNVNDNITLSDEISIVADPFANHNFHSMRYIEYMGAKWKITKVEVRYPKLILTVGGVYNGQQT